MQGTLKHAKLESVLRPSEREREVESGRADVFMTDYPYSRRVLSTFDWAVVIAPDRPVRLTDYAYAVAKGLPEEMMALAHKKTMDIKEAYELIRKSRASS